MPRNPRSVCQSVSVLVNWSGAMLLPEDDEAVDMGPEVATVRKLLDRASMVTTLYANATEPEDRKELLREIFARITIKDRTIVGTVYNLPFQLLLGDSAERSGSGCGFAGALLDHVSSNSL